MKKLLSLSLILATSGLLFASDGAEELANQKCGSCHLMGAITKEKLDRMVAPPYWAIAKKVKQSSDDKEAAVKFIVDYTLNPTQEKTLFPKETIEKFGIMPSQKGLVTEDEIKLIAEYILEKKAF
ncbi:MAG: cytochrome C [Sulfurimonas sp. RIFOXYD12_FULL_33_39]|uniref:c-type cytochrome n=1 Tax=unclassified Sulfurimonas TaxID=2623549 RepID=UPI0008AFE809|nr:MULTISPECIES: c-type cytochrome [unclassified Sulfurimonas]OHE07623.1 MAG: cytochrome C [Sulfurimonas sp. RIFCSPLOWO2_12_FULL_34_6]OHE10009.1 MAG: cytochrome C [Sulfurimonas sp. RIFOXYD12_FULL_33_39]OHE14771.1 MAG: cytochrome C [Sulfurimonas sp. RIFOXYD2_FULL_34_21]